MQFPQPNEHPHRRYNALTGEWIGDPHRTKRLWQGKVETMPPEQRPQYDPACYLCSRQHAGGRTSKSSIRQHICFYERLCVNRGLAERKRSGGASAVACPTRSAQAPAG